MIYSSQNYEDPSSRTRKSPNIATLQQTLEKITQIRLQLNRKLLSRHRYVKIRRYIGKIRMRIQRIIERTQDQKNQQTKITAYFHHPHKTSVISQNNTPNSDNEQSEDYRGESD